jgi:hypothetical protein
MMLQRLDEHLSNLRPNFDEVRGVQKLCLQEERLNVDVNKVENVNKWG